MKNSTLDLGNNLPPSIILSDAWQQTANLYRPAASETAAAGLPKTGQLQELLGMEEVRAVEQILQRALLNPIVDLTSRRGKRVRGHLVALACRLLNNEALRNCELAAEAVEFIHAGSLIVDDIEDGSPVRRGQPALHVRYSMPVALNAGNWLYFWPFELLRQLAISHDQLLKIYESCHRTLLRAHFGQTIDLGARIDALPQEKVAEVCLASMRLKTGALMGFAALLGAAVAHAPGRLLPVLDEFGRELGVALQMFDDLGNVVGKCEPAKLYEDLMLSRPSWVWACAADCEPEQYRKFLGAVEQLPDDAALADWLSAHYVISRARESARSYLDLTFETLRCRLDEAGVCWSGCALDELRELGEEIAVAYE